MTAENKRVPVDQVTASEPTKDRRAMRLESLLRDVGAGSGFGWATGKTSVLDQAYEAYCQCLEAGTAPDPDEFCERYPRYKSSLRRLIDVHHCIEENAPPDAGTLSVCWPEPGDSFLGFTLQGELGRGAFARVFLATEPALGNRLVAVKISLKGAAEAETLGRLEHPNVVPVYSVQKEDLSGLSVVCMPYLGGATLCDVLDRAFARAGIPTKARIILEAAQDAALSDQPMTARPAPSPWLQSGTYIDGVVHLGAQLADALSFVHSHGICHRDLKPSNILLTPDGTPMLLDFNLAFDKQRAEQRLGGTLPYMAPEHLRATDPTTNGHSPAVDECSDRFSLGVILYELLTGVHPFGPIPSNRSSRHVRGLLLERQECGARPLRQVNRRVDRRVAGIIDRCLAYDPADRPQSSGMVLVALRSRLARKRRARRFRGMLGAALLILVTGSTGSYFVRERQPYQRGLEAYRSGQYDRAVLYFNRVLETTPADARALFARGRAHVKQGDFHLALDDFLQANRLGADGETSACIGYCLGQSKQNWPAISFYQQAVDAGFRTPEVLNDLGYSYSLTGQLESAQISLSAAIQLCPDLQAAYHNRALVDIRRVGKDPNYIPKAGLADIEKAIQLGPDTAELLWDAARLSAVVAKRDNRRLADALNYVEKAIAHGQDPKDFEQDEFLSDLRQDPRYQALLTRPASPKPSEKALHIIDPVQDPPN